MDTGIRCVWCASLGGCREYRRASLQFPCDDALRGGGGYPGGDTCPIGHTGSVTQRTSPPTTLHRSEQPTEAVNTGNLEVKVLLYDYVNWEQLSKQRRGLMWALTEARTHQRTLVLPPFRFHTAIKGQFEYHPMSDLFDLSALRAFYPVLEQHEFVRQTGGRLDRAFLLQRGQPKRGPAGFKDWEDGPCKRDGPTVPSDVACVVSASGEERCATSIAIGDARVEAHSVSCGWSPDMSWDKLLRQEQHMASVLIGGIVYQWPPPTLLELAKIHGKHGAGAAPWCGWSCSYYTLRRLMLPRTDLLAHATEYMQSLRGRAAGRVLAVHWRRGDYLSMQRGKSEKVCSDEFTGVKLAACKQEAVLKTPTELAATAQALLEKHRATVVFLASNAEQADVDALRVELDGAGLGGVEITRYEPSPEGPYTSSAHLATLDTLICAVADAFVGTRHSMFTWNIFEERLMQGHALDSNSYM